MRKIINEQQIVDNMLSTGLYKGKSCIYKIDADDVNCYVNVNNINWEEVK